MGGGIQGVRLKFGLAFGLVFGLGLEWLVLCCGYFVVSILLWVVYCRVFLVGSLLWGFYCGFGLTLPL